ncbi:MAG: C39 family peptidase [Selenomonadaceae bacterium]|nr:C39 family peptidase [Selenomonadaceae bacterium]
MIRILKEIKKIVAGLTAALLLSLMPVANAEGEIPYPPGLDTKSSGASSASPVINHADSPYFKHLDFYNMKSTDTLTILTHYPTYQQTTEYSCGGAAALTVLYWYGEKSYDEPTLTKLLKTRPYPYGTYLTNIAQFFKSIGWRVKSNIGRDTISRYEDFQAFTLRELKAGHPILVENIEWGGHYRVIIGYDTMGTEDFLDDVLIFMDSYDTSDHKQDGYTIGNGERFFSMWFDHSMLKQNESYQPWIVAYPPAK